MTEFWLVNPMKREGRETGNTKVFINENQCHGTESIMCIKLFIIRTYDHAKKMMKFRKKKILENAK